jgi:hypothetical protein
MKTLLKTLFLALLLGYCRGGFGQQIQYPSTGVITVPPWDGSPIGFEGLKQRGWHKTRPENSVPSFNAVATFPDNEIHEDGAESGKTTAAIQVAKLKGFTANNLDLYVPGDNSIGISNGGYIVSADNYTIDYYTDAPDTLVQFQEHHVFYNDTTIKGEPFDPRVIYDRYANRFIVVTCVFADSAPNYLLISFSRDEDPRLGWNHYKLRSDTLDDNQWFDFPSIAVNKDELFISGNMIWDSTSAEIAGNKIFQIRKMEGYQNAQLKMRIWNDVLDGQNDIAYTVAPLSHGLMSDSYNHGIYMVSTKNINPGQSSDKLFWYEITDSFNAPNVMLIPHTTDALTPYSYPIAGFQLGTVDSIKLSNTKAHGGFYMDSTLNFVYCRNFNYFSVIVLNRLDMRNNTIQRFPLGYTAGQEDYSFPSIAFMGADSTDPDNMVLGYERTGVGIFPEMAAIHFDDGAFWPTSTVVRQGEGWIDYYGGNKLERWGDYTTIQRRYDSNPTRCWFVGSYPNGANANHWGATNLLNAYIAELGDSTLIQGATKPKTESLGLSVLPVPNNGSFMVLSSRHENRITRVTVTDVDGRLLFDQSVQPCHEHPVSVSSLASGIYFVTIEVNQKQQQHEKIVVCPSN